MSEPGHAAVGSALTALVDDVRRLVRGEREPIRRTDAVAAALLDYLGRGGLLSPEQREPNPRRARLHQLHREPDGSFSISALVWLPGQDVPLHEQVTWCVVGVCQGESREVRCLVEQMVDDEQPDPAACLDVGPSHTRPFVTPGPLDARTAYQGTGGPVARLQGMTQPTSPDPADDPDSVAISIHIRGGVQPPVATA